MCHQVIQKQKLNLIKLKNKKTMKIYLKNNSQEIFMPERAAFQVPKAGPEQPKIGLAESADKEKQPAPEVKKEIVKDLGKEQRVEAAIQTQEELAKAGEKTEKQQKPASETSGDKKKETANAVPAAQPAISLATPASPPAPQETPEQKDHRAKFEQSWLGQMVALFGGEKAKENLEEAYKGKGLWGFIGTLLGMTALSKTVETLAEKNPKAKQYIDQGKGIFKSFLDKLGFGSWIATDLSKDSFENVIKNVSGEDTFKSNFKLTEDVIVPDGSELVLEKDEKSPFSITAAENMDYFKDGQKMTLPKDQTIVSNQAKITLPAGTKIPAGTKFNEGFKVVVAARDEKAAPQIANVANKKEKAPETPKAS